MVAGTTLDVAVIGAGFAGIAMAHALAKRGDLSFRILEKATRAGGTWRDNTYPGCACDIPAHLYSLSFAPNPDWSRMFASQAEILDYLEEVIDRFGLGKHIRYGADVAGAAWDERGKIWRVALADGEVIHARTLVSAIGVLHHPNYPDIPGLKDFGGKLIHTAEWDHGYDVAGKAVAVIGTGASAVQVVPAIVDKVGKLSVFQRTAAWIAPRFDRAFDDAKRAQLRRSRLARWWFRAQLFWAHEKRATGFTKADPGALAKSEAMCRGLLDRQVKDPVLRAKLTPNYKVGCKRLIVASDYYPALQKPNVELVIDSIERIDATGIVTRDGVHHPVDAIVLGTGYDAQNPHSHLPIRGMGGRTLQQVWAAEGKNALLGTAVLGFPNLFLITGPHTGGGHNSQVFMIEAQVHYIMQALKLLRGADRIEVHSVALRAFAEDMDRRMEKSVWKGGGCTSWFLDPETGRNTLLWPSYSTDFWLKTRRLRRRDYRID
ncbi:flavin-containing monooxygenase [Sphingoaurantiacus capsulatus]|uniref:Flavin-containing monooxygenase n=1 Tax=Sphingoaurantiacus capsulatus TaxID=1771310 RepID=A0ABV7XBS4_9SPHN